MADKTPLIIEGTIKEVRTINSDILPIRSNKPYRQIVIIEIITPEWQLLKMKNKNVLLVLDRQ